MHEVGHAIVAITSGWVDQVDVSLFHTMFDEQGVQSAGRVKYEIKNSILPTEDFLRAQIRMALGGMAAQEIGIGNRSIGGAAFTGSDLDVATGIANRMVGSFGMGQVPRFYAEAAKVGSQFRLPPTLSEEVDRILQTEWENAKDLLMKEWTCLLSLAADLVVAGSISLSSTDVPFGPQSCATPPI
jgi:ATP-dependent Zn protease